VLYLSFMCCNVEIHCWPSLWPRASLEPIYWGPLVVAVAQWVGLQRRIRRRAAV